MVIIIQAYPCYQKHTKFCPAFFTPKLTTYTEETTVQQCGFWC